MKIVKQGSSKSTHNPDQDLSRGTLYLAQIFIFHLKEDDAYAECIIKYHILQPNLFLKTYRDNYNPKNLAPVYEIFKGKLKTLKEKQYYLITSNKFSDYPLSTETINGLNANSFKYLTEIQATTLPHALVGAVTGSGKTLAYVIPLLESLYRQKWSKLDKTGAIILVPTKELAAQVFTLLQKVGRFRRLFYNLDNSNKISNLQVLVLDEVDQLIEMGFMGQVQQIISALENTPKQTLMFSATLTASKVVSLQKLALKEPEVVELHKTAHLHLMPTLLKQYYAIVDFQDKYNYLYSFICSHLKHKTIVFMATVKGVRFMYETLRRVGLGMKIFELTSKKAHTTRTAVSMHFGKVETTSALLISTDVASRGLDFKGVDWVIHYEYRSPSSARSTGREELLASAPTATV